jgi:hypothetical protein
MRKAIGSLILLSCIVFNVIGQDTLNPKRLRTFGAAYSGTYLAGASALYMMWYKDYPTSSFHFFDDGIEWNQSDKYGHFFSAYFQSRVLTQAFRWTGMKPQKSAWLAAGTSFLTMSTIEIFDGFSQKWGASGWDLLANGLGAGFFLGQELTFKKQIIRLKYSFTFQSYNDPVLQTRSSQLYGNGYLHRLIKDYNGTTLWFCASAGDIFPKQKNYKWLGMAVGIGNGGMFGGEENAWVDSKGIYFQRYDFERYRRFMISPDIDLEKIETSNKFLKSIFFLANHIKLPLPTLEINTKGEFLMHPFYLVSFQKEF